MVKRCCMKFNGAGSNYTRTGCISGSFIKSVTNIWKYLRKAKMCPIVLMIRILDFVFIPKNRAAKLSGIIYVTFVSRQ